ncbi:Retrotransposon gag domain [Arabidopsis thaliana x Arabidopsis arenosa]|uniref:Retrotransposon gag domain n=1 Tax=Arabidopsis thaliana x Arabidopsis arenosa TaxID=1240361 RepID=A0A8T1Y2N6_9BRAS|nr:Retrotransposon gag domain [Arabidopsis thaliana x Arabidopsis arenosa]
MAESRATVRKLEEAGRSRSDMMIRTGTTNYYFGETRLAKLDCPRFSGDKVTEWLFKVEQFFEIDPTPDDMKIGLVSNLFDDLAATWHQWMVQSVFWKHVMHDWMTYKMLLQGKFKELEVDPIVELNQLQETDGIVDYHEKFELIKSRLNLPEAYLVSIFLAGLRTDMQINVKMFQPQSIEQCLMLGRLYEKAQNHWKRLTIKTDGDDYPKEAQPLNVQSDAARPSLSNFQVHNSSHEDKESSDGKTAIQQKISVEVESLLQQQELICEQAHPQNVVTTRVFHKPTSHQDNEFSVRKQSIQQESYVGVKKLLQHTEHLFQIEMQTSVVIVPEAAIMLMIARTLFFQNKPIMSSTLTHTAYQLFDQCSPLLQQKGKKKGRKLPKSWMFKFRKKIDEKLSFNLIITYPNTKTEDGTTMRSTRRDNLVAMQRPNGFDVSLDMYYVRQPTKLMKRSKACCKHCSKFFLYKTGSKTTATNHFKRQ